MTLKKIIICIIGCLLIIQTSNGQFQESQPSGFVNTLNPAVPFLTIPPLSGTGGTAFINTINIYNAETGHFGNPALASLSDKSFSVASGYSPWLRELRPDMGLLGISAYLKIKPGQYFGFDFMYFDLGRFIQNQSQTQLNPSEYAGSISYSIRMSTYSSVGVRLKYICSDLVGGSPISGTSYKPGRSIATDLGYSLQIPSNNNHMQHHFGVAVNNLGSKISYSRNAPSQFIPTSLKLGYGIHYKINPKHSILIAYEAEKYLIPTPPIYIADSIDMNGNPIILAGYDPEVSVLKALIRSFYDAPEGFEEEINEVLHHFGLSYSYKNISFRSGLFMEHATKGNRKFATSGLGYTFNSFEINLYYLIPFYPNMPIANTLGLSLVWNIGGTV